LRECFAAHQDDEFSEDAPPRDLAARTAERVAESDDAWEVPAADKPGFHPAGDPPAGILGWSLADLTVAGGVMLAVSMLIFPALRDSREGTRQVLCQNQMKEVGQRVACFARDHGTLPQIGKGEPTGMWVAQLIAMGYISADELAHLLLCPGSTIAAQVRRGRAKFELPTADQLQTMTRRQLMLAAAAMSPCYYYRFPYQVGDKVFQIRDDRGSRSPMLSDMAGDEPGGCSPNHLRVLHVLVLDGSVRKLTSHTHADFNGDDLFRNDEGKVAAALRPDDIVLGGSDATPLIDLTAQRK
jgi:hypothetical protein